jgi:hypothetical protein
VHQHGRANTFRRQFRAENSPARSENRTAHDSMPIFCAEKFSKHANQKGRISALHTCFCSGLNKIGGEIGEKAKL